MAILPAEAGNFLPNPHSASAAIAGTTKSQTKIVDSVNL